VVGSRRCAAIYLFAGFVGCLSSTLVHPAANSRGASGAVFGVFGALLACLWHRPQDFSIRWAARVGGGLATIVGTNLIIGWIEPVIDNTAHIGGLLAGALAGLAFADDASRRLPISGGY